MPRYPLIHATLLLSFLTHHRYILPRASFPRYGLLFAGNWSAWYACAVSYPYVLELRCVQLQLTVLAPGVPGLPVMPPAELASRPAPTPSQPPPRMAVLPAPVAPRTRPVTPVLSAQVCAQALLGFHIMQMHRHTHMVKPALAYSAPP